MNLLEQMLLDKLAAAARAQPSVPPGAAPAMPAPPPGFTVDSAPAAAPVLPAPPPGFQLDSTPTTPPAPMAASVAAPTAAPVDQSTALGDLKAGGLQALDVLTGGPLRSGSQDFYRAENDLEFGPLSQREDTGALTELQRLDAELATVEAAMKAANPRADNSALELQYLELKEKRGQWVGIGGGQTADVAARVAAAEANRPAADADATARADAALGEIIGVLPDAIARRKAISEIPSNPAADRMMQNDTWGGALDDFLSDPAGVARSVTLRSLPAQAPSFIATLLGQRLLGPAGAAAGGGLSGAETERRMALTESFLGLLNDAKVDVNDPAAVQAYLEANKDAVKDALRDSNVRAGVIGVAGAAGAGISGRVAEAAAGGSRAARVGAVGAGTVAETASEGAGEAAAMAATGEEIAPGDVLAEMIGGATLGAPQAAGQVAIEAARSGKPRTAPPPATPPAPPAPPPGFTVDPPAPAPDAPLPPLVLDNPLPADAPDASPPAGNPPAQPPAPATAADPTVTPPPPTDPTSTAAPAVDPANAAPPAQPRPTGRREKVITPNGELELDTEFEVVEMDGLQAAQGAEQPRDRANRGKQTTDQITAIRNNLDPARLMGSRESDRGAPIVDETNTVLSGNGRTAALLLTRDTDPAKYQAYLSALQAEGFDTTGFKAPMLVRRVKGLTPEQKIKVGVSSNISAGQELSPGERAMVDKDLIGDDMVGLLDGDADEGVSSASNRRFVTAFMGAIPAGERNALTDANGALTEAGAKRISAALFARSYGDKNLVERGIEQGQDKTVTNALLGAAGSWSRMRAALNGQGRADLDLTPLLIKGLAILSDVRGKGITLDDYANQADAFNPVDADAVAAARLFTNPETGRLASTPEIRNRLRAVAQKAEDVANGGGNDMFGAGPKTPGDVLRTAAPTGKKPKMKGDPAPAPTPAAQPKAAAAKPAPVFKPDPNAQPIPLPADAFAKKTPEREDGGATPVTGAELQAFATKAGVDLNAPAGNKRRGVLTDLRAAIETNRRALTAKIKALQVKPDTPENKAKIRALRDQNFRNFAMQDAIEAVESDTLRYALAEGSPEFSTSVPKWMQDFTQRIATSMGGNLPVDVVSAADLKDGSKFALRHPNWRELKKVTSPGGGANGVMFFTTDKSVGGAMQTTPDGRYKGRFIIVLSERRIKPNLRSAETLAHELGHMIQFSMFDALPLKDKLPLIADFANWLRTTKPGYRQIGRKGRATQTAFARDSRRAVGNTVNSTKDPYASAFAEWFADMTARHFSTGAEAEGTVAKFFAKVAGLWRKLASGLRAAGYVPESVKSFYDGQFAAGAANNRALEQAGLRPSSDVMPDAMDGDDADTDFDPTEDDPEDAGIGRIFGGPETRSDADVDVASDPVEGGDVNTDDQTRTLLDDFDDALTGPADEAVTDFVGHGKGKKNQPVDFTNAFGLMRAGPLEAAARDRDSAVGRQIERLFAPVREKLRAIHGDTIRLYRVQRPVEARAAGSTNGSAPADGQRAVLSWTTDPTYADEYAGVRKTTDLFTDAQIDAVVAAYEANGEATIPGTRKRFVNESATGEGMGLYSGEEYITGFYDDVQEIRGYMADMNNDRREANARNDERRGQIVSADVALDDVMLATDRAGQMEFVVRNAKGSGYFIDPTGKLDTDTDTAADPAADVDEESAALMDDGPDEDGYTPGFMDVSTTKGTSPFEQAWRDAGMTPDEGTLLPPNQQVNVLSRLLGQTFGMFVERNPSKPIKAVDAVNQMLDAYRNVRFMLHTLNLPVTALGLGGRLRLSLEGYSSRYLGQYNGATNTIHMPGRSNSFAHEWAHALDHYLRDMLATGAGPQMLTKVGRLEGLNPNDNIQSAFITLINRMFYDDAALALKVMELEAEAAAVIQKGPNAGQPTQKAVAAQEKLDRLLTGASRIPIQPSKFRADSKAFSPAQSGYFGSVHEMFARAFEAYVGHKMAMAGSTSNAFVNKGDENYTSEADARLALTFPKASERLMIFDAFDDIFHHIRASATLGMSGPAAAAPTDADLQDPAHWQKIDLAMRDDRLSTALKDEWRSVRNGLGAFLRNPIATLRGGTSALAVDAGLANGGARGLLGTAWDWTRWIVQSQRGFAKLVIARQPKPAQAVLQFLMGGVMTDPGTGSKEQGTTVEEAAATASASTASSIMSLLRGNNIGLGVKRLAGALTKGDNDTIRKLMFDPASVPGATAAQKAVAAGLRRIMNSTYVKAVERGLELGYVENQGYLPRSVRVDRVNLAPDTFRERAGEVYKIHFDNTTADMEPAELLDLAAVIARRNPRYAAVMDGYRSAVNAFNSAVRDAKSTAAAAAADPTDAGRARAAAKAKAAVAPARTALDDARADLVAVVRPDYASTSAEAWLRRIQTGTGATFDSVGPDNDFAQTRGLPKEAEALMGDLYEDDVIYQVLDYVHGITKRSVYQERFGKENKEFDAVGKILSRAGVKSAIRNNPTKYNPDTPAGRLNIIRDLADPKRDNIKEMALEEARRQGADPEDLVELRRTIERIVGSATGQAMPHLERFTTAVYVAGTIMLLPRAAITSLTEPLTFLLKTGDVKNTGRVFGTYLREAIRGAKSTKELAALAEMIGIVATPLHDAVMLNRVADGTNSGSAGNVILTKFFRANFLTQLTNAQRRAALNGSFFMMRDLARQHAARAGQTSGRVTGKSESIKADFRDLGVPDAKIEAFMAWLAAKDGLPTLDDLQTPEGKQFAASVARFVDQTIQNPRRADKTALAMSPYGRLVFGLTGFIYTFTRNMHAMLILRTGRDAGFNLDARLDAGQGPLQASFGAAVDAFGDGAFRFVGGFGLIMLGQLVVGALRAALFDADRWEEKEEDGELFEWLMALAVSRSGVAGVGDILLQSLAGLRYERDLTSLGVGPHLGYMSSSIQNIFNGTPLSSRNSANSENAEHTGAKSFYRLAMAPTAAAILSMLPTPGPVSSLIRGGVMQGVTSGTAADAFADSMFTKTERGK